MANRPQPRLLLRLVYILLAYRLRLALAGVALLVAAMSVLSLGQGLRLVIDDGFVTADAAALGRALVIMLVMVSVLAFASASRYYLVTWLGERLATDLRQRVFAHLLQLHPSYFSDAEQLQQSAPEVASRLTADTSVLQSLFGSSISMALRSVVLLVGAIILMLITDPWLAAGVLVGIPATLLPIVWFGRRVRSLSRTSQDRIAELGRHASESLAGLATLQAFTYETYQREAFSTRVEHAFQAALTRTQQRAYLTAAAMLVVFAAVAFMLWQGGLAVLEGHMSAGALSAFVFYAVLAAGAVATLAEVAGDVQRAAGAAERLLELLDTPSQITSPAQPRSLPSPVQGHIELRNVSFHYPNRSLTALNAITLSLRPGERVALVGPSGAGKSTLLGLLLRFHDPQSGQILLDGIDLKDLDLKSFRQHIGLVAQEATLFTGSIAENLKVAQPNANLIEMRQALTDANALDFVDALPQGLDTLLGPGGVQLSGGQRQRIAIARALLRNPKILLLDEATSALDAANEKAVQEALDRLQVGRTSLVIAHRLSTVIAADRLLVFDQGQLIAEGKHHELLESCPLYRYLADLQLSSPIIARPHPESTAMN